jgi:hypothetical protein
MFQGNEASCPTPHFSSALAYHRDSSELSVTVAAYFLLAAYRRDHGMMKLAIPFRVMAFLVGISDGGMWTWVGCYELLMGILVAWALKEEGGW